MDRRQFGPAVDDARLGGVWSSTVLLWTMRDALWTMRGVSRVVVNRFFVVFSTVSSTGPGANGLVRPLFRARFGRDPFRMGP